MTIPKSQGKQPYYDARKSQWGDLFPHGSKNKLVQRFPPGPGVVIKGKGQDVSKWKDYGEPQAFSYENVSDILKRRRWKEDRERVRSLKREEKKRLDDLPYDRTDA
jgi:ribosomal protein RSM22 (predicted rRNA methylase)